MCFPAAAVSLGAVLTACWAKPNNHAASRKVGHLYAAFGSDQFASIPKNSYQKHSSGTSLHSRGAVFHGRTLDAEGKLVPEKIPVQHTLPHCALFTPIEQSTGATLRLVAAMLGLGHVKGYATGNARALDMLVFR